MPPHDTVPYGYCHCRCGQKTPLAKQSSARDGTLAGQPLRYVKGHNSRRWWLDSYVVDDNGCWVWQGSTAEGYAIYVEKGERISVARHFYEQRFGPLPAGYVPDHVCPGGPNRACVNPDHIRPLTLAENSRWKQTTRLDWDKVREIRRLAKTTTQASLAEAFGVSKSQISSIVNNRRWRE